MKTKKQKEFAGRIKTRLIEEFSNYDTEAAHANADDCLCELLIELGYKDVVDLFDRIEKWYA